jgi:predicted SAM-dependent methyltransferase
MESRHWTIAFGYGNESERGPMSHVDTSEAAVIPPALSCEWLFHKKRGWQFGEQGLIEAIIAEIENDIPDDHRWVVEFGAGDGGKLPLTSDQIVRKTGWRSLLIDGDETNCSKLSRTVPPLALVVNTMVGLKDGETIDDHMAKVGCPSTPALMVIDVDGMDYYIATSMNARPYVLCIEHLDLESTRYNAEPFLPSQDEAGKQFQCPGIMGYFHISANTKALDISIPPMGYSLASRTRINSIYVRNDIINKVAKPPDGKIRLNIGAGRHNDPRYVALDIKTGTDARKLPYADNSVDEVYSSHLLEHFSFYETDTLLAEFARVLKPGGIMRIAVPDAAKMAQEIVRSEEAGDVPSVCDMAMVVYGGHTDATDIHHNHFTEKSLREYMNRAGMGLVTRFEPFIPGDCSNHPFSLNLEGFKRWWPRVEKPSVTCVLSQPRFTFTGHEMRMIELARKCDFNIQPCTGAFWERDMNVAIKEAIRTSDPDFLFFSDYDSVFEVDDYMMLLEAIQNDPQMAAIGAVQMSRHNDKPLVFEDRIDYSGDVCRVDFQHFGLTIIRREALEELNLTMDGPMFWSIPGKNEQGKWDWEQWSRSDGDITFWRNLKMLGFKVCQHNKVCIGHITQCVKYPRDKGRGVQLIPIENYWRHGKPKDATFNPSLYKAAAAPETKSDQEKKA